MKIVFYSTNSNHFTDGSFKYINFPCNTEILNDFSKANPNSEIFIFTQKPGLFLLDDNLKDEKKNYNLQKIHFKILQNDDLFEIAKEISSVNPDIVAPLSFWASPLDYFCLKDSMVAEFFAFDKKNNKKSFLKNNDGQISKNKRISVIANSVITQEICFDKQISYDFLSSNNFLTPFSFLVKHELFFAERHSLQIKNNVYKELIFQKLKNMHFPIVIKDVCGLSSYNMDVIPTFNAAKAYLESKKNNTDKLIQEYIEGVQFGCEIFSKNKNIFISEPFMFSVNKYGITSPKQSVKLGPISEKNKKFRVKNLKRELLRLAKMLKIQGSAQVDLVFSENQKKWYIIEINPRVSGMTKTVLAAYNKNFFDAYINPVFNKKQTRYVISIKFPILNEENIKKLKNYNSVLSVNQIVNNDAKQERERGYCEVIFGRKKTMDELKNAFEKFKKDFENIFEQTFYENAMKLIQNCC